MKFQRVLNPVLNNPRLAEFLFWPSLALGVVFQLLGARRLAYRVLSQVHRSTRSRRLKHTIAPWITRNLDIHQSHPHFPALTRAQVQDLIGRRLLVLKKPRGVNEPGVLFVMFSRTLESLPSTFDMPRLLRDYRLVLEPSWSGYCDAAFLQYTRYDEPIYVLAAQFDDFEFLRMLDCNLIPIPLGPCDWVDPAIAEPYLDQPKTYDIVMNSNWAAWKRHEVLFRALRELDSNLRVALIGVPWTGRTQRDVEQLAESYGVREQLEFYERIPFDKVMRIVSASRVSILLSLKEGSNRAIAESMFCNTPVIVLAEHVGGITKNVNPQTGRLVPERLFPAALKDTVSNYSRYSPRAWATKNISCHRSTHILNDFLRNKELELGQSWTVDIVTHANSPECTYVPAQLESSFDGINRGLLDYML